MIFTVAGIKGGTGKTTIATNLAVWLSKTQKKPVLLVDADEQRTATMFSQWRDQALNGDVGFTSIELTGKAIFTQLQQLKANYGFIIIDAGGRDTTSQRAALMASDAVLLPFQPRGFDFWTIDDVKKLLEGIRAVRPEPLPALAFLNRADVRSEDNRGGAAMLKETQGFLFLEAQITNRKTFSSASSQGYGVGEVPHPDKKAYKEIDALFTEILNVVSRELSKSLVDEN